ncbi:transposase [Acidobacteriia bacterium AH_259_A11_L15]|nr:transposase [Acidobacteriia bacterium AH_259_A11_L15]
MDEPKLQITRRRLPHWTLEGATYFVTFRIATSQLTTEEILSVRDQIISGDPELYELLAAVVLPDHVHLLLRPNQGVSLSRAMKGIKGATARRLNQRRGSHGRVWQDESLDRIVRDQAELEEKLNYMFLNPVKAGLTDDPDSYPGWFIKRK